MRWGAYLKIGYLVSDFGDLPIKRIYSDPPDSGYDPENCIDSDILTICKSRLDVGTRPSTIKLELNDAFDYLVSAVTIWRPFESEHYTETLNQQKGQRFEVESKFN